MGKLNIDIKSVLALVTLCGFFLLIGQLLALPVPPENKELINTAAVACISLISMVIGYYFGSSEGSAHKTSLLASKNDKEIPQ